tara:strand:+ start:472 stop:870 length:399 start_codon:yes stop_codon:yes gene_type:complete
MEFNPLIPIGTKIKVDKSKIKNVLNEKLLDDLPQIINGKVIDYKMTDGMGIGYILVIKNNIRIWIFSAELDDQTKKEYKMHNPTNSKTINDEEIILRSYKMSYFINGNRTIKTIVNPLNLFNWLIFTLKDIF